MTWCLVVVSLLSVQLGSKCDIRHTLKQATKKSSCPTGVQDYPMLLRQLSLNDGQAIDKSSCPTEIQGHTMLKSDKLVFCSGAQQQAGEVSTLQRGSEVGSKCFCQLHTHHCHLLLGIILVFRNQSSTQILAWLPLTRFVHQISA